jgi:hypothetical protein
MRFYKASTICLAIGLLFAGAVRSQAVTLADLIANNGTITSGDKVFSNFTYQVTAGSTLTAASGVNVSAIQTFGNYGLEFQGGWQNTSVGTTADALITYVVTAPGPYIIDNELYGNPFVLAGNAAGQSGTVSIVETLHGVAVNSSIGVPLEIHDIASYNAVTGNTDHQTVLSDHQTFANVNTLKASKDMLFTNNGLTPSLSFVDQTFSQSNVPEPGVLGMLLSSGIAGSLFLIRRKA